MITKDMLIPDVLAVNPYISNILMGQGMHCISCFAAAGETLEQAMYVHGFTPEDVDVLVADLNDFIEQQEKYEAENEAEAKKAAGQE
jgi:hybrid cluster-associated redox disulfide protein